MNDFGDPSRAAAVDAEPEPDERRQVVRVARMATGRAEMPQPSPARPPAQARSRTAAPTGLIAASQQAAYVAGAWFYIAPFLWVSPFLVAPPLWISALAMPPSEGGKGS